MGGIVIKYQQVTNIHDFNKAKIMFPENNKQIIQHYERSLYWIKSLSDISEVQWRMPIEPGKWSVAEVIGHLSPWDEFVLNHRIPFFFVKKCLPKE